MSKLIFIAIALLLIPVSFAFDCSKINASNQDICNQIQNSNISKEGKDILLSNIDYGHKFYPDHSFVYQWNTNLTIKDAPDNIAKTTGIFVRDAWMSIFAVMPSVLYNGSLYVPDNAKVLTGFNYATEVPQDYYNTGYPSTNKGDCQRNYIVVTNYTENKILVNNIYQGSGKLVNVQINSDSSINAEYFVFVSVNINHYSWQKTKCLRWRGRTCLQYKYECIFNYQENQQDNLLLQDQLNAKHFSSNLFADVIPHFSYDGFTLGFNYSNSAEFIFSNSDYNYYQFVYGISYSKQPYYIYTLTASDYNQSSFKNMFQDRDNFLINNANNVTIKAWDFFNSIEKNVTLLRKNIDFYIKTDKLKYPPNETISVSIYPDNISVSLTYGNQTLIALGKANFRVLPSENKIYTIYDGLQTDTTIYIKDTEKTAMLASLTVLGILNYFFYGAARHFFQGAL